MNVDRGNIERNVSRLATERTRSSLARVRASV